MPRPRISAYWIERVSVLYGQGLSSVEIERRLEEEAHDRGRSDYPRQRTIRRLVDAHRALDQLEQAEQRPFDWPAPFREGYLDFEFARLALDFSRYCRDHGKTKPTVRQVKWFVALKQSSDTIPMADAAFLARELAAIEYAQVAKLQEQGAVKGILEILEIEPWRSDELRAEYNEIARRNGFAEYPRYTLAWTGGVVSASDALGDQRVVAEGVGTLPQDEEGEGDDD